MLPRTGAEDFLPVIGCCVLSFPVELDHVLNGRNIFYLQNLYQFSSAIGTNQEDELDLDVNDPGKLRESALLNYEHIKKVKADQLPSKPAVWWKKLHTCLNEGCSTRSLIKVAVDQEDKKILEVLGILQLWVWHAGDISLGSQWSQVLSRVAICKDAAADIVKYLLSFFSGKTRDATEEIKGILEYNLAYITPTTVWTLKQEAFW